MTWLKFWLIWGGNSPFNQKSGSVKFFIHNLDHFLGLAYSEYWSQIWLSWNFALFGSPPFAQKLGFGKVRVKLFIPNVEHLLGQAYPENLSQIWLGLFLADFGGFTPLFCPKIGFWLMGVKIFIPNLNHLLVLAYPENLSQIRLGLIFVWF